MNKRDGWRVHSILKDARRAGFDVRRLMVLYLDVVVVVITSYGKRDKFGEEQQDSRQ